jgi:hypothetical protein
MNWRRGKHDVFDETFNRILFYNYIVILTQCQPNFLLILIASDTTMADWGSKR